jgi:hypothetical protein
MIFSDYFKNNIFSHDCGVKNIIFMRMSRILISEKTMAIPKKIHYCWLSKEKMPANYIWNGMKNADLSCQTVKRVI